MCVKKDERQSAVDCVDRANKALATKRRKKHKTNSVVLLLRLLSLFSGWSLVLTAQTFAGTQQS
jgi:hypothetical protein